MTRKSKREIERALSEIANAETSGTGPAGDGRRLKDTHPDHVVTFVQTVFRDLLRICHQNPDTVVNVEDPESLHNYLDLVHDEYGIDGDRDDDVQAGFADAQVAEWNHSQAGTFASFALAVPVDGTTLEELVDADRQAEAERVLVGAMYELLADVGANEEMEFVI